MRIDILIPVYNKERTIEKSVKSALAQVGCEVRVVIVDNDSKDKSAEIVERVFSEEIKNGTVVFHKNPSTVGPTQNWNVCLDFVENTYFKFLFADDILSEDHCSTALKYFEQHEDLSVYSSGITYINEAGKVTGQRKYFLKGLFSYKYPLFVTLFSGNRFGAPSNLIFKLTGELAEFPDDKISGDISFIVDFLKKNKPKAYFSHTMDVLFEKGDDSITGTTKWGQEWLKKNYDLRVGITDFGKMISYLSAYMYLAVGYMFSKKYKKEINLKAILKRSADA